MEIVRRFESFKVEVFHRRAELTMPQMIALSLAMAALTGILAQMKMYLPFTPVPITLQTFAVLLSGVVLGKWWGGVSMAFYAIGGLAGIPWFANAASGFGATFGYIIGFVLASMAIGFVIETSSWARRFSCMLVVMGFVSTALIYIPGVIWLNMWLTATGKSVGLATLAGMGLTPFIVGDVLKAVVCALVATTILPKQLKKGLVD